MFSTYVEKILKNKRLKVPITKYPMRSFLIMVSTQSGDLQESWQVWKHMCLILAGYPLSFFLWKAMIIITSLGDCLGNRLWKRQRTCLMNHYLQHGWSIRPNNFSLMLMTIFHMVSSLLSASWILQHALHEINSLNSNSPVFELYWHCLLVARSCSIINSGSLRNIFATLA